MHKDDNVGRRTQAIDQLTGLCGEARGIAIQVGSVDIAGIGRQKEHDRATCGFGIREYVDERVESQQLQTLLAQDGWRATLDLCAQVDYRGVVIVPSIARGHVDHDIGDQHSTGDRPADIAILRSMRNCRGGKDRERRQNEHVVVLVSDIP